MNPGDVAPDFVLPDDHGTPRTLSDFLASGPVALFFYPAAMTGGCTAETCHFRDLAAGFGAIGAHRVGISPDSVTKLRAFSAANAFDYPLLSDVDGKVARLFGVWRALLPSRAKRHTFVIDDDHRIVEVIRNEHDFSVHGDRSLAVLRQRTAVA
ncbi:peroxiredoxin [Amycolatopsis sp. NPDC058986]|uniref:peroxiredoxin n=1 Tax=unclassified Amycolatopsis TaxID=2618356 RepID=UPI0036716B89